MYSRYKNSVGHHSSKILKALLSHFIEPTISNNFYTFYMFNLVNVYAITKGKIY